MIAGVVMFTSRQKKGKSKKQEAYMHNEPVMPCFHQKESEGEK